MKKILICLAVAVAAALITDAIVIVSDLSPFWAARVGLTVGEVTAAAMSIFWLGEGGE